MRVFVGGATDRGRVRKNNEDYFGWAGVADTSRGAFVGAVADGVGGAEAGEEASRDSVETFLGAFSTALEPDVPGRLTRAVEAANAAVHAAAVADQRGTTLVVAAVIGNRLHALNVGDSRLYLVRDGAARQISLDHNWVAEQVRAGQLSPEAAKTHRYRNVITRCLGFATVQPDLFDLPLRSGDRLVLCSDGLIRHVADETIAEVVGRLGEQPAAEELTRLALDGGGTDNITVVVVRVSDEGGAAARPAADETERTAEMTLDVDATIDAGPNLPPPPPFPREGGRRSDGRVAEREGGRGAGEASAHAKGAPARRSERRAPRARRSPARTAALVVLLVVTVFGIGGAWLLMRSTDGALRLGAGSVAIATAADGSLYVAQRATGEVLVYTPEAVADPAARLLGLAPTPAARWAAGEPNVPPTELGALAIAPDGRVLVVDAGAGRVRAFASDGRLLAAWGRPGAEPGSLDEPTAIAAAPDGRAYVLDAGGRRIQAFDAGGQLIAPPSAPTTLPKSPVAIAVDAAGRLYVLDAAASEIVSYDAAGQLVDRWSATDDTLVAKLSGLAVAPDGRVWVADSGRGDILALDASGRATESRPAPRSASAALREPNALALGPNGQVYVLDRASGDLGVLAPRLIP